jgi:hypothetical protein
MWGLTCLYNLSPWLLSVIVTKFSVTLALRRKKQLSTELRTLPAVNFKTLSFKRKNTNLPTYLYLPYDRLYVSCYEEDNFSYCYKKHRFRKLFSKICMQRMRQMCCVLRAFSTLGISDLSILKLHGHHLKENIQTSVDREAVKSGSNDATICFLVDVQHQNI